MRLGELCGKTTRNRNLYFIGTIDRGVIGDFCESRFVRHGRSAIRLTEALMVTLDGELFQNFNPLGIKVVNLFSAPADRSSPLQWEAWAIKVSSRIASNGFVYMSAVLPDYLIR